MMSKEERQEILDLLAGGQISVDEAAALLRQKKEPAPDQEAGFPMQNPGSPNVTQEMSADFVAADLPGTAPQAAPIAEAATAVKEPPHPAANDQPAWLRVKVRNLETGKDKVSINIPVRMLKFGLSVANRFAPDMGVNWQELQAMLDEGASGLLVDVRDDENQEHVQVYLA